MAAPLTPDLCVIGAGASGIAVAEAAVRLGASVAMVERGTAGGQSLRSGALALAALGAAAEKAAAFRKGAAFGVTPEEPRVNFRRMRDHIAEILTEAAPDSGPAKLTALGIDLHKATARFIDQRTLWAGNDTEIRARRFVIATGARPLLPDVPGLLSVPFFTTETIFENTRKLSHLLVIGAGPMGIEIALSYRRLGCDVTLIEPGPILAGADPELAEIALRRLRDDGVNLLDTATVVSLHARSQGIGVVARSGDGSINLDVSHILVAPVRAPNLLELDLDAAKVKREAMGTMDGLKLNASLRTSNPRVFALGEAMGPGVAHDAAAEADIVVRTALLGRPARYEPEAAARLTLTDPPIAEIGLTEPLARARFKDAYTVVRAPFSSSERARATRETGGVVKVIVAPDGHILGAGMVGPGAGELAAILGLCIARKMKLAELAGLSVPFPGHGELLRQLGEKAAAGNSPSALESRLLALNRLLP
ncbi:MAG: FAD-dependent oxidoreductase [Devosia sp.]